MSVKANIKLTIYRGESLVSLNPGGTSNPYVTATIGSQSVSTSVVNKTTNPNFNSTFTFLNCSLPCIATLRVFNKLPFVEVEDPMGSATVTLFDFTTEPVEKTVQLSHSGNVFLAQRSQNGNCGSLLISYEIAQASPEGEQLHPNEVNASNKANNAGMSICEAAPLLMPVPQPANITGVPAHPVVLPTGDSASTASSTSTQNVLPAADAIAPSAIVLSQGEPRDVKQLASLSANLTPPSMVATSFPDKLDFLVANSAPAPPAVTDSAPVMNTSGLSGYVSYPVPGVNVPSPDPSSLAQDQHLSNIQPDRPKEQYYANNALTGIQDFSSPPSNAVTSHPTSTGFQNTLPVASPATHTSENTPSNPHDPTALARTPAHPPSPALSSTLFPSAAQPPLALPQPLQAVAPSIDALPPPPLQPVADAAGATRPPAWGAGALRRSPGGSVVAVAPPTLPLSSSAVTSRVSTPASLTPAAPQPLGLVIPSQPLGPSVVSQPMRPSGVSQPQRPSLVSSSPPLRPPAAQAAGARRPAAHPDGPVRDAAVAMSAAALYADPRYLLEAASRGGDITIFRQLRAVDPRLTRGFTNCVDYAGRTLLHLASWHGQLEILQVLLAPTPEPVKIDLRTLVSAKSGNTILHAAASGGHVRVIHWLLYGHPTVGMHLLHVKNARGMTAADCAKEAGFEEAARLLIQS